jgi:hypothetical protein
MTVYQKKFLSTLIIALVTISVGCSGDKSDSPASEPDQAVTRVARGLADGKPEIAWQALPPSYRKDVSDLVHSAATKMDADVWNQSFALIQKITQLARDKRDFILDHPMVAQSSDNRKELEQGWDALVGIFDVMAKSDLSDLKKLERLDIDAFLAETGGDLMKHMERAASLSPDDSWSTQVSNLKKTKATIVSSSGDSAVVRVETPGVPTREEAYTQVEGHWVPEKLAKDWDREIAKARQQIEKMSTDYMAENKAKVLMQLSMAEGAVDSLLAAENAQDFNAALGPIIGMAMGAAMAQMSSEPSITLSSAPTHQGDVEIDSAMQQALENAMAEGGIIEIDPSTGAPSTRDERQMTLALGGGPELHEPGAVPIDDAHRYVGQILHVTTHEGMDAMCRLKEARENALIFERNVGGGTISFEVAREEIDALRTLDR